MTACPKLTELTIICLHPARSNHSECGFLAKPIKAAHPAMLGLVGACRVLPNFNTFQIVYFPSAGPLQVTSWGRTEVQFPMSIELPKQQRRVRKEAKYVRDLLMDCLKQTGMKATLKFVELGSGFFGPFPLDSAKVEVYEV